MRTYLIILTLFLLSCSEKAPAKGINYIGPKMIIGKDSIVLRGLINNDTIEDLISYPTKSGNFNVYLSNKKGNYVIHGINLTNFFPDFELDFGVYQSFEPLLVNNNLAINVRFAPKYKDGRTISLFYNKDKETLSFHSFYDISINTLDPDLPKDSCFYTLKRPFDSNEITKSVEEYISATECSILFNTTRSFVDFYREMESGLIRDFQHERLTHFLEIQQINKNSINQYNNIGYFLEQAKMYEEAAFILEKVLEKFPNRIVAYINLGDAYWGKGDEYKARKAYSSYVHKMKEAGKEAKIPQRVFDRLNQ